MDRTVLLRVLLAIALFVSFAVGGIVIGNVVADDEQQVPELALSEDGQASGREVPTADEDVPGGQRVALAGDGGGGTGGGGGGTGGDGGGTSGGGDGGGTSGGGASGDSGDGGGTSGDGGDGGDGGGDGGDGAGAGPDGAADQPDDGGGEADAGAAEEPLPRLEHEGLARWLDECAAAEAEGASPQGCPEGVGAVILGELDVPFAIEQVAVGPGPWARSGCNPSGHELDGGLEVVVATSHPASVTVAHGRDGEDTDERWSPELGARTEAWQVDIDAGRSPRSIACVLLADLPDGPRPYVLDVTAVSALEGARPPRATAQHEILLEADPEARPPVEVRLLDYEGEGLWPRVQVRVPGSRVGGDHEDPRVAHAAIVPEESSCQAAEDDVVGRGGGIDLEPDGAVPRDEHPDWDRVYDTYFAGTETVEEGKAYVVCAWWTLGDRATVVEREQRTLTMPDLQRWRVRLDRVRWNDQAEPERVFRILRFEGFGPDSMCEAVAVTAPEEPAGVEEPLDLTLCDSAGGRVPFLGVEVWAEDLLCESFGMYRCAGTVRFELDDGTPPRRGDAWLTLGTQVVDGSGVGDCLRRERSRCLQYIQGRDLGEVHLVWEPYDVLDAVDAPMDPGAPVVGPGEDFTSPVLVGSDVVVRDTGDPLRPAADVVLEVDRPVGGTVFAITYERGCESKAAPVAGAGPGYVVSFADLCPGARYRFMAQLIDTARLGRAEPGEPITTYYAYDPRDWPAAQDADFRSWPAGSVRTPALSVDIDATAHMVNVDDGEVEIDRYEIRVGRLAFDGGAYGECTEDAAAERGFTAEDRTLRAVVPIEVEVDVSTSNACGGRRPGRVASVRGVIEISLADLVAGRPEQVILPDRGEPDTPRVIIAFDDVQVVGVADDES